MEDFKQTVADNISKLRKYHGFTQIELAEKLNYSDKAVSKWERAEALPDVEVLTEIAKLFDVSLDYLVSKHDDTELPAIDEQIKKEKKNKIIITLLSVTTVWVVATFLFVALKIFLSGHFWTVFVWAVPPSVIILIVFNGIWGKRKYIFVLTSILVWSIIAACYLQIISINTSLYTVWYMFLLGAPVQVAMVLWANLKSKK